MKRYKVVIADNFHYLDGESNIDRGYFDTRKEAVAAAMRVVDEWLQDALKQGVPLADLYDHYTSFGDDAFVVPLLDAQPVNFSSWGYARQRCDRLRQERSKDVGSTVRP